MLGKTISFQKTGYFSSLICDYLSETEILKPFYNRFPKLENFKAQIEEKQQTFSKETRLVLNQVLIQQYKNIDATQATLNNIEALKQQNTFTVTTGHQLNLFTGPLYFLHKIVSTINLAKQLQQKYPENNFVPVYWMATEDHDFNEINYFNFKGKKIQWNYNASGAVGELKTNGLDNVLNIFSKELGISKNAETLKTLFKNAYLEHDSLAQATLFLANALFAKYGLVIIDANNKDLKQLFVPYINKELTEQVSYNQVSKTNNSLGENYKIQVNPREINLFYLDKNLRERIVFENEKYKVLNTTLSWSQPEILEAVKQNPQQFSPNVILRPLYQEVILPNLCYIGGGGELAYWFQLQSNFKMNNVVFPMLLLRNSVLIQTQQQAKKLEKLNINNDTIFLKRNAFINKKVREISNIDINFSKQIQYLKEQFKDLHVLAKATDKSFLGAVLAQEKKQIKGIQYLEKRLLKAQKRKLKNHVERITALQNQLFPNQNLQERVINFSELYLEFGDELISELIKNLQPLQGEFVIITI